MSTQKLSKTTLVSRFVLIFAVIFVVVFGTLSLLSFLGLESYGSPVAGAVAGVASVVLNLILNRRRNQGAKLQLYPLLLPVKVLGFYNPMKKVKCIVTFMGFWILTLTQKV